MTNTSYRAVADTSLLRDGGDDADELGLHGRAAHEEAVDVRAGGELRRVLGVGRAAVLDANLVGGRLVHVFGDVVADALVRLLRLLRRGRDARADGPDLRGTSISDDSNSSTRTPLKTGS